MNANQDNLSVIELIGDELENFYQLGLADSNRHQMLLHHGQSVIRTPWPAANTLIHKSLEALITPILEFNPSFSKRVNAYSEGLGVAPRKVASALLIPEAMCSVHKWLPGIPHTMLGCSTIISYCHKRDALIHGRVLDFPFHSSFDVHERAIISQLGDGPKMLSFGSAGVFYPSISVTTEHGITLSLHQKFSDTFNYKGTPIFDLIYEMLQKCESRQDVIKFLKKSRSLTSWGLYMSFADNSVLDLEIYSDQLDYKVHHIKEDSFLYFCNERQKKKNRSIETTPYGLESFNEMRQKSCHNKITKLGMKKSPWSAEKILRMQGVALEQSKSAPSDWLADNMTPSTLQNICFIPKKMQTLFIAGKAPKFFNNSCVSLENYFDRPQQRNLKITGKRNSDDYQRGQYHLMQAQVAHDLSDTHKVYHHLQLAIDFLQNSSALNMAKFFFNVFQYIHEDHKKTLAQVLLEFKKLDGALPSYLNDHCLLFIARLEKVLGQSLTIGIEEIKHPSLQRVYEYEMKMPKVLFHSITRSLMAPRIEILDIFYPHVKA